MAQSRKMQSTEVWSLLEEAVLERGLTPEQIKWALEHNSMIAKTISDLIANSITEKTHAEVQKKLRQQFQEEWITPCQFTRVDGRINSYNPSHYPEQVRDMDRFMLVTSSEAKADKRPARAANPFEWLRWLALHPEEGKDYRVICLERYSAKLPWEYVPFAGPYRKGRELGFLPLNNGWVHSEGFRSNDRFLFILTKTE